MLTFIAAYATQAHLRGRRLPTLMLTVVDVVRELTAKIDELGPTDSAEPTRDSQLSTILQEDFQAPVLELAARGVSVDGDQLAALSDVVRRVFPPRLDARLPPRARVFTRLMRTGHGDAAWLVAQDNAVGVVREEWKWSTSSGAARPQAPLPLLTVCESEHAYAWLPGFRDPRFDVPDECYDISDSVRLQCRVEEVRLTDDALVLSGRAHLKDLATSPDETVRVVATRTDRTEERAFQGTRLRRPDQVKGTGLDLTRLAYAGWSVSVDLHSLRVRRATTAWRLALEVAHDGLHRSAPLGPQRGTLVDAALAAKPHRSGTWHTALSLNAAEQLHIRAGKGPDWRRQLRNAASRVRRS